MRKSLTQFRVALLAEVPYLIRSIWWLAVVGSLIGIEIRWEGSISGLAGALAWPTAVVAAAYLFRTQIGGLIDRVESLSGAGVSAQFQSGLSELADVAASVSSESVEIGLTAAAEGGVHDHARPGPDEVPTAEVALDTLRAIAPTVPPAAVMMAWRNVEIALGELVTARVVRAPQQRAHAGMGAPTSVLIARLKELGMLPATALSAIQNLRELRNLAAHASSGPRREITESMALQYIDEASRIVTYLRLRALAVRTGNPSQGEENSDES